jgi:hypothetical protein
MRQWNDAGLCLVFGSLFLWSVSYAQRAPSANISAWIADPRGPLAPKTGFLQSGISRNKCRVGIAPGPLPVRRRNERLRFAGEGWGEFAGLSRRDGLEVKTSTAINRYRSLRANLAQLLYVHFRDGEPHAS